ncbi:Anaphase-promoting complex subunit 5 [Popillia japonica]|uniref:Anaphase-promoting complex subunit 5 n=1 Tax=Popillia japonica TaxID=7064 RepID=A0AAW1L702_POPJA
MANIKDVNLSKKRHIENITPHRITVSVLIYEFCNLRESEEFQQLTETERKKIIRSYCILLLKLIQSPDIALDELLSLTLSIDHVINNTLIERVKKLIYNIVTIGVRYLLDIIDSIGRLPAFEENTVKSGTIHIRNSVVGYFLRRFIIFFDKLTFSEVIVTLESYKQYFNQSCLSKGLNMMPSKNKMLSSDWYSNRDQWSRRQAELFIATQATLLTNNPENALSPVELHKQLRNLLRTNSDLPEAHFLEYLNYLRVKDFCGAIESLYHCFDKSTAVNGKGSIEDKTKSYRFAALNLAVLHYYFNHKDEALTALKEAIKMAQEASDNVCLQHALSWLYCLTQCNRDKLIEHSILKSLEINLSYIMSLGILSFGQYGGLTCGNPKQIFETLTRSDLINYQHSHLDLISHSFAQKSSLWLFYGKTEMSSLWSQLLLNFNANNKQLTRNYYGEGFCDALCNVATYAYQQGEYGSANALYGFARERFPNEPISHVWMLSENIFQFTYYLYHEKFLDAENMAQKISTLNKWESCLRMAEMYLCKCDYSRAHSCVNQILSKCQEGKRRFRIDVQVRAMILLAEIQCGTSFPDFISPGILTLLNSSLAYCSDYHLEYYTSLVELHIAHVQLLMGMPTQALSVLDRCLVQILANGGFYDRGRALLLHAKCLVAYSKIKSEEERKKDLFDATTILSKARDYFQQVEAFSKVKNVLLLQAQIYNEVNAISDRNKCTMEYRIMDEEHPTNNLYKLITSL